MKLAGFPHWHHPILQQLHLHRSTRAQLCAFMGGSAAAAVGRWEVTGKIIWRVPYMGIPRVWMVFVRENPIVRNGGFLSHRGIPPSHHPFLDGISHEINQPLLGHSHLWKPPKWMMKIGAATVQESPICRGFSKPCLMTGGVPAKKKYGLVC